MLLRTKKIIDYYFGTPILLLLGIWARVMALRKARMPKAGRRGIGVLKMQGGGSLIIALPALLSLRRRHPDTPFLFVGTSATTQFAALLGVFDRMVVIDDANIVRLAVSAWRALRSCRHLEVCIDLEVFSRLTTVFLFLTGAASRIAFFLEDLPLRKPLCTQLVFFNRFSGLYFFYDQIAMLLGAETADIRAVQEHLRQQVGAKAANSRHMAVGVGCSEMARERLLTCEQWIEVLRKRLQDGDLLELHFLGTPQEAPMSNDIITGLKGSFAGTTFINHCGTLSLTESVRVLSGCGEYLGIDSGLTHLARLLCRKVGTYWGPTHPATRLRPVPALDESVHFKPLYCSPCVHVSEEPPCKGNNLCIQCLFDPRTEPFPSTCLNTTIISH